MSIKRVAATSPSQTDVGGKRRIVEGGTTRVSFPGFYIEASLHGDKGARRQMEDEHLVLPSLSDLEPSLKALRDFAIFAIFDGHGGRQSAAFVKAALPAEIATQLKLYVEQQEEQQQEQQQEGQQKVKSEAEAEAASSSSNGSSNSSSSVSSPTSGGVSDHEMRKVLYAAFQKVDSRIATEIPACRDGCTAVFLMVLGKQAFIAGLGDSAAYLARRHATGLYAIPLTEMHRPYLLGEKERILRMGGSIEGGRVNGSLEITRSFGDMSLKRYGVSCVPTLKKLSLSPPLDEFILLGCDGFWGAWTATEAINKTAELIDKEKRSSKVNSRPFDPAAVCRQLVEFVLVDRKAQVELVLLLLLLLLHVLPVMKLLSSPVILDVPSSLLLLLLLLLLSCLQFYGRLRGVRRSVSGHQQSNAYYSCCCCCYLWCEQDNVSVLLVRILDGECAAKAEA